MVTPRHFNSHTREGVTKFNALRITVSCNFNSHTREGVTVRNDNSGQKDFDFNSHTREGVTNVLLCYHNNFCISTHTPVRV